MTKQQAIDAYKHIFGGLVLDAYAYQRNGTDGSAFLRQAMKKIDATLGEVFEALTVPAVPPDPQPSNGTQKVHPTQPVRK